MLAVLAVSCGEDPTQAGVPTATASCSDVEFPPVQFGSHLIGDAEPPVDYSSTPPSSGWHTSGAPPIGIHESPPGLSEPQQVATLEAGGVVITHGPLEESVRVELVDTVESRWADRVVITPYAELSDGEVALASWGAVQRCTDVDTDAIEAFVTTYAQPIELHG